MATVLDVRAAVVWRGAVCRAVFRHVRSAERPVTSSRWSTFENYACSRKPKPSALRYADSRRRTQNQARRGEAGRWWRGIEEERMGRVGRNERARDEGALLRRAARERWWNMTRAFCRMDLHGTRGYNH